MVKNIKKRKIDAKMKKIYILILILIFFSGCVRKKKEITKEEIPEVYLPTEEEIKEVTQEQETPPEEKISEEPKQPEKEKKVVMAPKKIPPSPKVEKKEIPPAVSVPKIYFANWNGECLIYNLKWSSINFGKAIFICGEEQNYYRLVGITIPDGLPAKMGYGYNRIDSFIDKKTGKTTYSYLYSKTGKTEKIIEIFFNWNANQLTIVEKKLKDKKIFDFKKNVVKFEGDIFDCLTAFYLMRNADSNGFKNIEIPIALPEIWYLRINLKAKTIKNLPNGETKEVFIIEPLLKNSQGISQKEKLNIWITTDNEKLPVYFEGRMFLGKAIMNLGETKKIDLKLKGDINKIIDEVISTISS